MGFQQMELKGLRGARWKLWGPAESWSAVSLRLKGPWQTIPLAAPRAQQCLRGLEMRAGQRHELRTLVCKSRVRQSAEAGNFTSSSDHIPSPLKSEERLWLLHLPTDPCLSCSGSAHVHPLVALINVIYKAVKIQTVWKQSAVHGFIKTWKSINQMKKQDRTIQNNEINAI